MTDSRDPPCRALPSLGNGVETWWIAGGSVGGSAHGGDGKEAGSDMGH